jgi:predicted nucleic acid-binding protein
MALAAPSIVEAYAVLTRLPSPYRLSPGDAHALLASNFLLGRKMVSLDDLAIRRLLDRLVAEGIAGGQTYDAVIASCARRARVAALLTFNESDFEPFAGADLQILVPGRASA